MTVKLYSQSIGSGAPLLILHGLFGSGRNWRTIAQGLAPQYRVITADLRNHGNSPHADDMSYPELVTDVLELLDSQGLASVILLGHSLGGKVAMATALLAPERVTRLIAVDIAPVAYPRHQPQFFMLLEAMQALPLTSIASRTEADGLLASRIKDPVLRSFLLQNLVRQDDHYHWRLHLAALAANLDTLIDFPLPAEARVYPGPSGFIYGELSNFVLMEHADIIQRWFPLNQFLPIANAGHWPHTERPEEFLKVLQACLMDR